MQLGQMVGLHLPMSQIDQPLGQQQLAQLVHRGSDPRSAGAIAVLREGWTLREALGLGVGEFHPVVSGPQVVVADYLDEWFAADACDCFWIIVDTYEDGIDAVVDGVVPILQERGLFHRDYEGATLREHIGAPEQYGIDPRPVAAE